MKSDLEALIASRIPYQELFSAEAQAAFWARVLRGSRTACWPWQGWLNQGYGDWRAPHYGVSSARAHRVAYELVKGTIPGPLVLDHLCRNRACCNPDHLEPVSDRVNTMRGIGITAQASRQTHCHRGHPLAGDNLRLYSKGTPTIRHCFACHLERSKLRKRRVRAEAIHGGYCTRCGKVPTESGFSLCVGCRAKARQYWHRSQAKDVTP